MFLLVQNAIISCIIIGSYQTLAQERKLFFWYRIKIISSAPVGSSQAFCFVLFLFPPYPQISQQNSLDSSCGLEKGLDTQRKPNFQRIMKRQVSDSYPSINLGLSSRIYKSKQKLTTPMYKMLPPIISCLCFPSTIHSYNSTENCQLLVWYTCFPVCLKKFLHLTSTLTWLVFLVLVFIPQGGRSFSQLSSLQKA